MNSLPDDIKLRFQAWREFSKTHIDPNSDITLFVLKVHLVLERLMTSIIAQRCVAPEHLSTAKLSFHQKSRLLRAFVVVPISDEIFSGIELLNQLRNDLAHTLDRPKMEKIYKKAFDLVEKMKPDPSLAEIKTGKDAILYLAGACEMALSVAEVASSAFESYQKNQK